VALVGVIGADGEKFRWPGPTLLALALASLALISSIQYGFHARARLYSAGDVETWWGTKDLERFEEELQKRQKDHFQEWDIKIAKAVSAYNIGVSLLGAGVAMCAAPEADAGTGEAVSRWVAFAAVAAWTVRELVSALREWRQAVP
jgi:hypothetical protein